MLDAAQGPSCRRLAISIFFKYNDLKILGPIFLGAGLDIGPH